MLQYYNIIIGGRLEGLSGTLGLNLDLQLLDNLSMTEHRLARKGSRCVLEWQIQLLFDEGGHPRVLIASGALIRRTAYHYLQQMIYLHVPFQTASKERATGCHPREDPNKEGSVCSGLEPPAICI